MLRFLAILSVFFAFPAAFAGETEWAEIGLGARIRLISSDVMRSDGTSLVGLEVDMPADIKTYWRVPGESGIPTQIDISGSKNVVSHEINWPYPQREVTGGYIDFVYHGPVVLPIRLVLSEGQRHFQASVTMGICADICIPVRNEFSMPLNFDVPDRGQGLRLRQAMVLVPLAWNGDPEPIGAVKIGADGRIDIALDRAIVDPGSIIVDNGDPTILFGLPQKSPTDDLVTLQLLDRGQYESLQKLPVRVTFVTGDGAFELFREVQMRTADGVKR